jgi:predicted permease
MAIAGWLLMGYALIYILPKPVVNYARRFIDWIGIPVLVITSTSVSNLAVGILIVPLVALTTIAIGAIFSLIAIDLGKENERILALSNANKSIDKLDANLDLGNSHISKHSILSSNIQASFLISGLIGNARYISFPIILMCIPLSQTQYFTWVVIFDILIGTFSLYLIAIVTSFIHKQNFIFQSGINLVINIFQNKIFWSLIIGLILNSFTMSDSLKDFYNQIRSLTIPLVFIAVGMQIKLPNIKFNKSVIRSLSNRNRIHRRRANSDTKDFLISNDFWANTNSLNLVNTCLFIKMLLLPLVMAGFLISLNFKDLPIFAILLQIAMPPLLIDREICEKYNLSQDFNSAANYIGWLALAITFPIIFILSKSISL